MVQRLHVSAMHGTSPKEQGKTNTRRPRDPRQEPGDQDPLAASEEAGPDPSCPRHEMSAVQAGL